MKRRNFFILTVFLIMAWGVGVQAQVNSRSVWPMFRHDRKHTGQTPYSGPSSPTVQWVYPTTDGVASSASIGEDGTIYIGAGWFWQVTTDHHFYAINPDGTLKWKFEGDKGFFSSPAIGEDGAIYVGCLDGFLYVLEDSVTYPKLRWSADSYHIIMNSPTLAEDSSVYYGALNFRLFAADYYGNPKWEDTLGWCVFASTAIDDDGKLYVGSKDQNLYKYEDLDTAGNIIWNYGIGTFYDGHMIDASPAIGPDGTIYIAADQFGKAGHSSGDVIRPDTAIYAINPDGTRKWALYIGNGSESSIGIGKDNMIYFGANDSSIYAVRDMGTYGRIEWEYKTGGMVDASPTIGGDGTIYIGSRDSTMYAFNPDGSLLWTFEAAGGIESSVTINGDGRIYFGGMEGAIYCLGDTGDDAGPAEIGIPTYFDTSITIDPYLKLANYRTTEISYDAILQIDTNGTIIYADTVSIIDQPAGAVDSINLASWITGEYEFINYNITATTLLPGDMNPYNDTLYSSATTGQPFVCGDGDGNQFVNILDITYLIAYLYQGGPAPVPLGSTDVDSSGAVNILDITFLIAYLYQGGPQPVCL